MELHGQLSIYDAVEIVIAICIIVFDLYLIAKISSNKRSVPVFVVLKIFIVSDVFDQLGRFPHDYLAEWFEEEVLPPSLVDICAIFQLFRWYLQLMLIPLLSLIHFSSLAFPVRYRNLKSVHILGVILVLCILPTVYTIVQFTACCGFIFHIPYFYWDFDETKDSYMAMQISTWVLQGIAAASLILADLYLIYKLRVARQTKTLDRQNVQFASAPTITANLSGEASVTRAGSQVNIINPQAARSRRTRFTPETKLAFAFIYFSVGFGLANVSFYVLINKVGFIISLCQWISTIVEYTKYIGYLSSIRTKF
ncbi:unnamed protein product, partial [Mesorhabditis spiculigera]